MSGTVLLIHSLSYVADGDEVVVGRVDTGSYAALPADGAELLKRIAAGMALDEAAQWYEDTFHEQVDVDDFVETLRELGFVRDEADGADGTPAAAPPVRFQRLGRVLLSPVAWVCYAAVFAAWLAVAARHSALRPAPHQIFFTRSLILVQLVITLAQVPLILAHEEFHILAGRRLGLPTRLRLSNRLTYIVAETQINGLLSVPRRKRYLPFLAGMGCDVVVFSGLGLVAAATRHADGSFPLTGRVCLALAFTVAVRFAWQFQLYLRTDLYYVFATALNCHDLHDASKALLKNRVRRALGRRERLVDEERWTARDRAVGRFYGPFIVFGVGTFIALTALVSVPVGWKYFDIAGHAVTSGHVDGHFWDGAVSLLFNVTQIMALVLLSRSKRRTLT
ncbi:hypothetical protein [Catenulispora subtropica]|uniref:PqqD family protein n=1 Tax=Catenulispora subtropica TaxID=450798 RepID=A0ABP5DS19_9ACTN